MGYVAIAKKKEIHIIAMIHIIVVTVHYPERKTIEKIRRLNVLTGV